MQHFHCDELISVLNSIPENYFDLATVTDCLKTHPIDEASLHDYLYFDSYHAARNLVFKNDLFELTAACWNPGQASPVQSYPGRKAWIALFSGRLQLNTYKLPQGSENIVELTDSCEIRPGSPVAISPHEPIHQVLNLTSFKERAVSLHVYSPPLTEQTVYETKHNRQSTHHPRYDTRYGNRDQPA